MDKHAALLIIDVQNDFCPGGALAVADVDAIIPMVNNLAGQFSSVVITQDWRPAGHISFASNHSGAQPFDMINLDYGPQVLWPAHCVMSSAGAALHKDLDIPQANLILRKGSAFLEADRRTKTGLDGYLASRGITEVYLCGLATDYCVAWSAEDAVTFGLKATIIEDACRAIDLNGSLAAARALLEAAGIKRISSTEV